MLKRLFATGWRRLAIVFLVVWEAYWSFQWRTQYAEADRLAKRDYEAPIYPSDSLDFDAAYAASNEAPATLIASPFLLVVAFLAGKWVARGFERSRQ